MTTSNGTLPKGVMSGRVTSLRGRDAIPVRGLLDVTEVYVRITSSQFHHMVEAEVSRRNKEARSGTIEVDSCLSN